MTLIYYFYAMLSIVLTGISQLLLKIGARNNSTPLGVYLNPATMMGYFMFLIVTVCSIFALKGLDLKLFYALTSLNYVVVMVLSRIVLREGLSRNKVVAGCLIVAGVVVFNL
jgi:drug/metabolite transporter (DMT)-like permease